MKSIIDIECSHCFRCDAALGKSYLVMSASQEICRFSGSGRLVLVEPQWSAYEFGRFCSERCADKHVRRIIRRDGLRLRKDFGAAKSVEECARCRRRFSMSNLHTKYELDEFKDTSNGESKWKSHETLVVICQTCMPEEERD